MSLYLQQPSRQRLLFLGITVSTFRRNAIPRKMQNVPAAAALSFSFAAASFSAAAFSAAAARSAQLSQINNANGKSKATEIVIAPSKHKWSLEESQQQVNYAYLQQRVLQLPPFQQQ